MLKIGLSEAYRNKIIFLSKFLVIASSLPSFYFNFFPGKIVLISVIASLPILYLFFDFFQKKKIHVDAPIIIQLFIFYGIICLLRGFIDAKSSKDWAILATSRIAIALILPYTIYLGASLNAVNTLFKTFLLYILPLSLIILVPRVELGFLSFSHTISPIYLVLLFLPYLNFKYKVIVIVFAFLSITSDLNARSNFLNIFTALLICITYFFRKIYSVFGLIKFFRYCFLIAPIVFLILGLTGTFNIFDLDAVGENYNVVDKNGDTQDLLVDSRTSIYRDVFTQLDKDNSQIFGLGASGKTTTSLTDIATGEFDAVYKDGRPDTESGMLNYIQWGGLVGAILYYFLFIRASFFGIYKSKNWLCVMLGLWVSYKALFSFIEDTIFFSIYSVFILLPIGMCLNTNLRNMTDDEITQFLNNIFKWK